MKHAQTPETRAKISAALKGRKFSNLHRANIRKAARNRGGGFREKQRLAHLGKVHTPETREKMRESRLCYLTKLKVI